MDFILNFFRQGGPFMYILVMAGVLHLVLCGLTAFTGVGKKLTPLLILHLAALPMIGLLGTVQGLVMAFAAVAVANPEYKMQMMANGISISLYTLALACFLSVLFVWPTGLAIALRRGD